MDLNASAKRFVLHWGEMGARWGINRTVAQIHALLFLSPKPITAEEIADALSVARSNVSNSLKELQGWGIVRVTHVMGDRRDHFESMKDVWEMFRTILDERKKRETDPTLHMLRESLAQAKSDGADAYTRQRLSDMLEFFEMMTNWYEQTRKIPTTGVQKLCKLGDKVAKLMGVVS
ncbi:MAG TPA: GbsR/MarR family transcriptional regulator [Tepidisphaeraceae bacterium]|nr:GbsR/MarR family transcriptional regulator [Tepidisphaeraceae bacterium]